MNKKICRKLLMLCIAFAMIFAMIPAEVFAATVQFPEQLTMSGGGGGGKGEVAPRGFAIDINGAEAGGLYWLESEYDNSNWNPIWTGVKNGYSEEIPAVDAEGNKIPLHFNAYVDKNPGKINEEPWIVLYCDGEKVDIPATITIGEDTSPSIGTPLRDPNIKDPSEISNRWFVPITLELEPGHHYEFAFLKGITANNGVTACINQQGTGYLQTPTDTEPTDEEKAEGMTMSEKAWFDEHKYDEYQYRELLYQTVVDGVLQTDESAKNPTVGTYHPMRFSFDTAPIKATGITMQKNATLSKSVNIGTIAQLKVTVSPDNATDKSVKWTTSNKSVATVTSSGKVKAVGAGVATIEATTTDGEFTCSQTVKVKPAKTTVNAVKRSYNSNTVSYKKVSRATSYIVYRATSLNGTYEKIRVASAAKDTFTDYKLKTGQKYYYKVKACMKVGEGKFLYADLSKADGATPALSTSKLTAKAGTKKITQKWTKVAGARGYEIWRSAGDSKHFKKIATKNYSGKNFTSKGLKSGKTYYEKVRAYRVVDGKKVYGKYSNVVKVKVK